MKVGRNIHVPMLQQQQKGGGERRGGGVRYDGGASWTSAEKKARVKP